MDEDLGPCNKVVKEKFASTGPPSPSGKQVDHESDGSQAQDNLIQEEMFDTEEDLWFDCQQPPEIWFSEGEKWYECRQPYEDDFFDCKQFLPGTEPKPYKPVPEPSMCAFPCVLMILSCYMLSMQTVGMMLKIHGLTWGVVVHNLFIYFKFLDFLYDWLNFLLWPPPGYTSAFSKHQARRKKLLLTALAIAGMRADSAVPDIQFGLKRQLRSVVRKATGHDGALLSARLSPEGVTMIRNAIESLPTYLFHPGDSKHIIIDSGCSIIVTGDKNDLQP